MRDDTAKELKVQSIESEPKFIQVKFSPAGKGGKGVYLLHMTVPEDAPTGSFSGPNMGRLLIRFDHPRVQQLELKLQGSVVGLLGS